MKVRTALTKILVAFALIAGSVLSLGLTATHASGPDPSFGDGGRADLSTFRFFSSSVPRSGMLSIAADSEGIYLTTLRGTISKLYSDGTLDTTYGRGGYQSTAPFLVGIDGGVQASALVAQDDGKVLVAGANGPRPFLSRLSADGFFDLAFGDRGSVFNRRSFSRQPPQEFTDVAVARDGRIYASGVQWRKFRGQPDVRGFVSRFFSNGRLDRSFGRRGRALFSGPDSTGVYFSALELSKRGRIVVLRTNSRGTSAMALNQKGRVIRNFGRGRGSIRLPYANRLETAPSGRIMAFGVAAGSGPGETAKGCARLYAFNWAGFRSRGFSKDGIQYLCPSKFDVMFPQLRFKPRGIYQATFGLQGDGKPVVGLGLMRPVSRDGFTMRLQADGTIDRSFADQGLFQTATPSGLMQAEGLPDGVLIAAGDSEFLTGPSSFVYRFAD